MLALFILPLSVVFAGEPVTAMPNDLSCYVIETALLDSKDTFTGRCDYDFEFEDAPRPETIRLALEEQRVVLDQCMRRQYDKWELGDDLAYELTILLLVDPKQTRYMDQRWWQSHTITITSATDQLASRWNARDCVQDTLVRMPMPEDIRNRWKDPRGYSVVWHFASPQRAQPLAPRTLPEIRRPEVLPGTSTFEDE